MRYPHGMLRRTIAVTLTMSAVVACAMGSSESKSVTPGASGESHPAEWYTIGAARQDWQTSEHEFDLAAADCQTACKALASLERAANHLCAVAEPDECTDARARVDRARRAVSQQCGGC
jgi:hypothetical protein